MKKVILDLATTLDGVIEGPNGEIDWCIMEDDMDFDGFLTSVDTIFYGRVSYDAWGNYQPEETASSTEQSMWESVHSKKKFVFSTRSGADNKTIYINGNITDKVMEIKNEGGKDIWLYGGAGLIKTFIDLDLIDIYRLSVHPIALGAGKPLFEDLKTRLGLRLIKTNSFKSGVVQLIYEPASRQVIT